MPRTTKAQREAEDRLRDAFDAGGDHFGTHPEDDMTTVHRYASAMYPVKAEALEFAEGYSAARRRRDEFLQEKGSQP
jgi:hypothetical protein